MHMPKFRLLIAVSSSLTSTTTTTMRVVNDYACKKDDQMFMCKVHSASRSNDINATKCRLWQNDKELNSSSKYEISRSDYGDRLCILRIKDVQEMPDAQPTDYRCSDRDTVGQKTYRLWIKVKPPVNSLVLTVNGQAVADGGMLNMTALSHVYPPPIIQCSGGPARPAEMVIFQLPHLNEPMEENIEMNEDWFQLEVRKVPGHLFTTTMRKLANDTQLVAGKNLSCVIGRQACQIQERFDESLSVFIIGKYERSSAQLAEETAVSTDKVPLVAAGCVVALLVIVAAVTIGVAIVKRRRRAASQISDNNPRRGATEHPAFTTSTSPPTTISQSVLESEHQYQEVTYGRGESLRLATTIPGTALTTDTDGYLLPTTMGPYNHQVVAPVYQDAASEPIGQPMYQEIGPPTDDEYIVIF